MQVTGKCGSVMVRLIPAPRGTGIVSAPVPKKLLNMAGIEDCYTSAKGCTATLGNFGKESVLIPCNNNSAVFCVDIIKLLVTHVKYSLKSLYLTLVHTLVHKMCELLVLS